MPLQSFSLALFIWPLRTDIKGADYHAISGTSSVKNVVSVVTKDPSGHYYLIACNSGSPAVTMTANLSALITSGTGTQWEFSSTNNDAIIGSPTLSSGTVTFTIPANATELLKF